jgi:AcrR family transcriptional regulator
MAARQSDAARQAAGDGVVALLWHASPQGRRGPKPKLTVEQIADAGIAIADASGLDAVTMQRVADRLGATKMALYRYVPGRAELDAVMLDRALGEPGEPGEGDWRSTLTQWATELHGRASARPWSVELAQRAHVPGPSELAWIEAGLSTMRDLALEGGERLDVLALLVGHTLSIVRQETGGSAAEAEMAKALAPVLKARAREYPFTAAAFARPGEEKRDKALRFGIERVIAGVEVLASDRLSCGHS